MVQSFGSQQLPVNYYAPLSQRSTIENGYNILEQRQGGHPMNHYPDFHQGAHDPTMAAQRLRAQHQAQAMMNHLHGQGLDQQPTVAQYGAMMNNIRNTAMNPMMQMGQQPSVEQYGMVMNGMQGAIMNMANSINSPTSNYTIPNDPYAILGFIMSMLP